MTQIPLSSYPEGVPDTISVDPKLTLTQLILDACDKHQNNTAFSCQGEKLSFNMLKTQAMQFASYLQNHVHIKPGDRIAIMLPNLLQYPVTLFGAMLAGATVVNVNPLDRGPALQHQLTNSDAKAIIVLENFVSELQDIMPKTQIQTVIITAVGDLYPTLKRHLINFVIRHVRKSVPQWKLDFTGFREALTLGSQQAYEPVSQTGTDLLFLQYTGGTTGLAKGVMLTHSNLVTNIMQAYYWIKPFVGNERHTIITALPLYHIFSLMANCCLFMYMGGENVLIPNPRDLKSFVSTLRKTDYTAITGVNTLFNALNKSRRFRHSDFSHLRLALGGGMAVQAPVAEEWQRITGKPIIQAYGLTETSPAVCINPIDALTFTGSVGLPLPNTEVSIRDDNNQPCATGDSGEVCVRGPQVMQGYWRQPEITQEVIDSDNWFHTGDAGFIDEQGFVYLVDRIKDMIISSGFNVYPAEVENTILQLPDIAEVAVVGIPNEVTGEQIHAFIVLKENVTLTRAEVRDYCHKNLTAYKVPKVYHRIEALPKSSVGKILKRALRDQVISQKDVS